MVSVVLGPPVVGPPVDVPLVETLVVGTGVVGWVVVHVGLVITLVSSVTAPLRASSRPSTVAPVVRLMSVSARIVPRKVDAGAERRGAADLPEDVARLRAVGQQDVAGRRGRQRRTRLEDEYRVRVALRVERQVASEADRGRGVVDTRRQGLTSEVGGDRGRRTFAGGLVVAGDKIGLRALCHSVAVRGSCR